MKLLTKTIILSLAVCLMLGLLAGTVSAMVDMLPFKDVETTDWFYHYVDHVYRRNKMKGVSSTEFAPDDNMTRAMAVSVLLRDFTQDGGVGMINTSDYENPFSDVEEGRWYTDAVLWASEFGIVKGRGNGTFDPHADVTRAEFCTMLVRYLDFAGITIPEDSHPGWMPIYPPSIPDEDDIPSFAKQAMYYLISRDIVNGVPGENPDYPKYYCPMRNITRASVAAILMRVDESKEQKLPEALKTVGIKQIDVSIFEDRTMIPQGQLPQKEPQRSLTANVFLKPGRQFDADSLKLTCTVIQPNEEGVTVELEVTDLELIDSYFFANSEAAQSAVDGLLLEDGDVVSLRVLVEYGDVKADFSVYTVFRID